MPNNDYLFEKENEDDVISWVYDPDMAGEWLFTFDGEKIYNMFEDYPDKLTKEEKEIFDKENPYWAKFFAERSEE